LLENSSENSLVDYYRCDRCGHVWANDKRNPDAPPRDIMAPPKDIMAPPKIA